jgi:hypothetical protein
MKCQSRWPCGVRRSSATAGIAGSNPTDGMDIRVLCTGCLIRGLCDRMKSRLEESYHVRARVFACARACVCVCARACV